MASSSVLPEEERKLLREYRLTSFPPRRGTRSANVSPTILNTISRPTPTSTPTPTPTPCPTPGPALISTTSTTTTTTLTTVAQTTTSISAPTSTTTTRLTETITIPTTNDINPVTTSKTTTATVTSKNTNKTVATTLAPITTSNATITHDTSPQPSNKSRNHLTSGQNSHRHHHHHHHHHHHSGSNHRRHKSLTPTHELTTDELNQMLELVSELSFLKLVPPNDQKVTNHIDNIETTFMFKKVNYIKRMNQRRKAWKKSKKARSGGS